MTETDDKATETESSDKAAIEDKAADFFEARKGSETITVQDMYELLSVLREGLALRDKAVDHQQYQIELNQQQIEQNKKILAKRGLLYKLTFASQRGQSQRGQVFDL